MNTQTQTIAAPDALADAALDIVSGGKAERHEVTREEYDRILLKMINDARRKT